MSRSEWKSPEPADAWQWSRERLAQWQVSQFNRQLDAILPLNRFYQRKLSGAGIPLDARIAHLDDLESWPTTTKQELVESAAGGEHLLSTHHTYPRSDYVRLHRTSGTRGNPLMILDTSHDWQWWSEAWQHVLRAADVTALDRVFMAFSFGPFVGFWSAHQACIDRGATVIPAGGLSSLARLEFMRQSAATVVCCTPTYALHLAEVANQEHFPLPDLPVDRLIVAGEAGGSIPAVRKQIETAWQAEVIDHSGATEVGPWGFGWRDRGGLHVIETHFIAEVLPFDNARGIAAITDRETVGELVLTSLGRHGAPVIRYRTGDLVRVDCMRSETNAARSCNFLWMPDGVVGRCDDMVTVRGVNVFPASIENIVRELPGIGEYVVHVTKNQSLDELKVSIEASADSGRELEKRLMLQLGLRATVECVPRGSLPRSEAKSQRWIKG